MVPWEDDWELTAVSPLCRGSHVAVPKRMRLVNVDDAIRSFCHGNDNTALYAPNATDPFSLGVDIVYNIYPINTTASFWLSANFRASAPEYWECRQEVIMTEHECVRVLNHT